MREEGANLKAEQDGSHLKRHLSKQLLKDQCGSINNSGEMWFRLKESLGY